ncbi:hypothetical protein TrLO_g325 [Triparma laevis f. longispina]|uniref:Inosine/uridine-preferring nucleoside hydrolase domain-containing protein n=1 Tax=Triparma laevis f. longispina TaxID=1714387 RepID=A0A9W7A774_9STRA|nr:hypothetical protein TrLO_g325 [Triparma laevis f. longispina]
MKFSATLALLASLPPAISTPVKLIIDTDLGFDVDDVGALSVAHHLQDIGKAEIIAILHNTAFPKGIGGVDVIQNYYNSSAILGAYEGAWGSSDDAINAQDKYTSLIEEDFPSSVKTYNDVNAAVDSYRRALESQEDNSVVIASIGELTNLRDILKAEPQLFAQKVKSIYYMDGGYNFGCGDSDGSEWSPWLGSTEDCDGAAQYVVENVPTSVKQVFSLNGADIYTGSRFNDGCGSGPVKMSYQKWTNYGSRPSWDPITIWYAVYGESSLYSTATAETTTVDYYGREVYDKSDTSNNMYQTWIDSTRKGDVTKNLDDAICAAPCLGSTPGACGGYTLQSMKNCWGDRGDGSGSHGASDLETPSDSSAGVMTLAECMILCDETVNCEGVSVSFADGGSGLVNCFRKGNIQIDDCDEFFPIDTWVKK